MMKKTLLIVFTILLLIGILIVLSFSVSQMVLLKGKPQEYDLHKVFAETDNDIQQTGSETPAGVEAPAGNDGADDSKHTYNEFCEKLAAENSDFTAWLAIDGTSIDYPLMSPPPDDPDYYLKRDFYKRESVSGTPYIGSNCSLESDNAIIYGHNMENGTMFSDLLLYRSEKFFKKHPTILIQTASENALYDIIAVFKEEVHYKDETNVFRYYDYVGNLTPEQFDEYVNTIKDISFYDTGLTAEYGEKLISLSTCSHYSKNGRFVVVAVKNSSPV